MSGNIGAWPTKAERESTTVIHICKVHGRLIFASQVCRNKVRGKVYYQCKACRTIKRDGHKSYEGYMGKIK